MYMCGYFIHELAKMLQYVKYLSQIHDKFRLEATVSPIKVVKFSDFLRKNMAMA